MIRATRLMKKTARAFGSAEPQKGICIVLLASKVGQGGNKLAHYLAFVVGVCSRVLPRFGGVTPRWTQ